MSLIIPGLGYLLTSKPVAGLGWLLATLVLYVIWWNFRYLSFAWFFLMAAIAVNLLSVFRTVRAVQNS